jgi:hypothetical protein
MKENRVNVEVSQAAYERLMREAARRQQKEGRGKQYPLWRIIDELLMSLPDPDAAHAEEASWR